MFAHVVQQIVVVIKVSHAVALTTLLVYGIVSAKYY